MPDKTVSEAIAARLIVDRIQRNLYSAKEILENMQFDPEHPNAAIASYIICRERMLMAQEDIRELRTAAKIDALLTEMGVR
jgi:hypothetical protein